VSAYYVDRARRALAPSDLTIDTEQVDEEQAAALIADAIAQRLGA
jgi:hypothetical protein